MTYEEFFKKKFEYIKTKEDVYYFDDFNINDEWIYTQYIHYCLYSLIFKEEFEKIAKEKEVDKIIPILNLDAEIKLDDVNKEMVDSLKELEPFGEANKMPIFAFRNLKIRIISVRSASLKERRAYER
jgi:hypothetical protein